jgi:hypothetical protein
VPITPACRPSRNNGPVCVPDKPVAINSHNLYSMPTSIAGLSKATRDNSAKGIPRRLASARNMEPAAYQHSLLSD